MIPENMIILADHLAAKELEGDSSGHDIWHARRVSSLARIIAVETGADTVVCQLAAILHDIPDDKRGVSEKEEIARLEAWMGKHGMDGHSIDAVTEIIRNMSFRGGNNPPMESLEGKVVQDADRLDAIGAIGIARTFAYSGSRGQPLHDPDLPPREKMDFHEYRHGRSTAVNHFHEKLLKLPGLMNTDYGRRLALKRKEFMEEFLENFMREWNLSDPGSAEK